MSTRYGYLSSSRPASVSQWHAHSRVVLLHTLHRVQRDKYLNTQMDRYKYIQSLIDITPQEIIEEYNLITKVRNGFVMYEIWRVMYGLSQSDILEKKLPKTWISEAGYGPCKFMPVL